jgi:endonuclease YncB( thermonuclease family)
MVRLLCALIWLMTSVSLARAAAAACAPVESRADRLADIDDRLEITLEDGARARLFGVEPANAASGAIAAIELRALLTDRALRVDFLSSASDRWGRRPALVAFTNRETDDTGLSLAEAILDAGLARARVEPGPVACLAPLFAAEARARTAKIGVWADPGNAPIAASARDALLARAGKTVIVEGRVTGVGETASRLYLNFGPIRTVDFAATLSRAALKTFATAGIEPRRLTGALVRVRGLLDTRFGPQVEIVHPAAIEIVAPGAISPYNRQDASQ